MTDEARSASASLGGVRIAGVRVSPSYARLLAELVAEAGYKGTATKLTDAIRLQALEPALTLDDHDAILASLETCPPGLAPLRRELLDEQLARRRMSL